MVSDEKKEEKKGKRTISVRGVKSDIYKAISETSRKTGSSLGEITNDAYRVFLSTVEGAKRVTHGFIEGAVDSTVTYISDIKELGLTNDEMRELKRKVCFKNISTLDLSKVESTLIEEKISDIINVKRLILPHGFSKIKILDKCRWVDSIEQ